MSPTGGAASCGTGGVAAASKASSCLASQRDACCWSSCAAGPITRGRIDGLNAVVQKAEANGAMRCAPRELAIAKSHILFAQVRLDQGRMSDAQNHLEIAAPNALVRPCAGAREGA